MKLFTKCFCAAISTVLAVTACAQNPLITNMYSADPSARVFGDSVYIYPSHDIIATEGKGRPGWFCMEDYHVYASNNLTTWRDNGIVVTQNKIPWVRPNSYSMWAPDCIERNGKYYFYFPTAPADTVQYGRGFTIGVAVADNPAGPFVPQAQPIKGIRGIDPNVFIDKDGQAYLYWSLGNIYGAKLKENMLELDGEVKTMQGLPADKGLKEGPYLFERNGKYYMTYPHVANKTERLEYAVGDSPLGPFTVTGVIMDETPGCWTNHHSIINYNNQWYLFYHANDLSPNFDKARSIRADSLFFNEDGSIKKVTPTLRGIGVTQAASPIQIDRYTATSPTGVTVDFIDTLNRFGGWKAAFSEPGAWLRYNTVSFPKPKVKSVIVRAKGGGGSIAVRLDSYTGPLLATVAIPANAGWQELKVPVKNAATGVHHLLLSLGQGKDVEIDWIRFE